MASVLAGGDLEGLDEVSLMEAEVRRLAKLLVVSDGRVAALQAACAAQPTSVEPTLVKPTLGKPTLVKPTTLVVCNTAIRSHSHAVTQPHRHTVTPSHRHTVTGAAARSWRGGTGEAARL
eukprot:1609258-Pyramimonas_sp.AAC.3